jgi:dTDP-4-amino-4,6-dideoxy-D-galactose acyltransferase
MKHSVPCEILKWDTDFFSIATAKVTSSELTRESAREVLDWCRDQQIKALYFLCGGSDVVSQQAAETAGFQRVDGRLTLEHDLEGLSSLRDAERPAHRIRAWQPVDLEALKSLAAASHHDTRFYSDPFYSRTECDRFYSTWIERSCGGYDDRVWVSEDASGVTGYVTGKLRDNVGAIGLIAVAERARGMGCGSALVRQALEWFRESGGRSGKVVTQSSNIIAQRLYQRNGFVIRRTDLWYHWHPLSRASAK